MGWFMPYDVLVDVQFDDVYFSRSIRACVPSEYCHDFAARKATGASVAMISVGGAIDPSPSFFKMRAILISIPLAIFRT